MQNVNKSMHVSDIVKQSLISSFVQIWRNDIMNSPKCLNYRMYKTVFGFEKYLTVLPTDLCMHVCKFRCVSNKLPIEAGRFFNIDRSERCCNLCNVNELGDEFHYLFKCSFFKGERAKFLPKRLIVQPNMISLEELMCTTDLYMLTGLAKFCKIVMKALNT